jgi:hypothetical protein
MNNESERNVEKTNHDIIYGRLIPRNLHGVTEENEEKNQFKVPCLRADILTRDLRKTKQEC